MKGQLIKNYINKLSISDVNNMAIKNNINLSNDELNYIYNQIKNNYHNLLYGDSSIIFNDLKNNVSSSNYEKIKNLFDTYKQKYQNVDIIIESTPVILKRS